MTDVACNDGATDGGVAGRPLSSTERSRRRRERLRAERRAAERAAERRRDDGPMLPGNVLPLTHGAASARARDPLAQAIIADLLASEDCPGHVREPRFRQALESWARQAAIVVLLERYIAGLVEHGGLEAALSERVTSEETSEFTNGRGKKRTRLQRLQSAVEMLDRAERRCQSLRNDLLLTPLAAKRAGLDVAPKFDSALFVAEVLKTGAGEDGDDD